MENKFKEAVEASEDIAQGFEEGLRALKRNSLYFHLKNEDGLQGSVDIDTSTKEKYPNSPRWDYAIGYNNSAFFAEVHPAESSEVTCVINKLQWLREWLKTKAPKLQKIRKQPYIWIPSGRCNILKNSRYYRLLSQNKIRILKDINKAKLDSL